jgi:hypothetical protein
MSKKLLPILMLAILAACTASPTPEPTAGPGEVDVEEQAVYAAALENLYAAPAYVLLSTSATDPVGVENTAGTLAYVLDNLPGVDETTVQDFSARNSQETPIETGMQIGAPYTLLTRQEMSDLFSENQNGWDVFYAQHADTPGITSLSRVGFNTDLTQALVYVGTQSHWLSGTGYYLLLEKVDGLWSVVRGVMTWIS